MAQTIYIQKNRDSKKKIFFSIVALNICVLAFFKYFNFFLANLEVLLKNLGIKNISNLHLNIMVPLGISFFTFWTLSYLFDVYSEKIKPEKSLIKYLIFSICFPHVIAGPIVRAKEFLAQLNDNLYLRSNHEGFFLILYGLIKKIFLADIIGRLIVNDVFNGSVSDYSSLELLLVVYCYSFQIFLDFSAYSDMAIGLGKIFGIQYPINFKYPYTATNPSEFWKRWHISFSFWLRDYLFLPIAYAVMRKINKPCLFKIKNERWAYITGMSITMLLCGLWHGASWTFIMWGGIHGLYLIVYNVLPKKIKKRKKKIPTFVRVFVFFNLISLAWIFFRSPSIQFGIEYIIKIFRFNGIGKGINLTTLLLLLLISIIIHYIFEPNLDKISKMFNKLHWTVHALIFYAFCIVLVYFSEKEVAHQAFIYFNF
jgi:D-alanyl-lipoteichoic acid acyltransferase DltB (MBOAT superfamily)